MLPEGPCQDVVMYFTKADRSDETINRDAAVKRWQAENGRAVNLANVRWIVMQIMETREDVERYGK